ncbi:Ig-like domain-containing protein, partial [Planctomycetota bacterium]|nr:Ig-like domain-containing protein [Planctomycetota bacterium]
MQRLNAIAVATGLMALLGASAPTLAQTVPTTGPHFYAVENLDRGVVERRGMAGSNGVAFPAGIVLAPTTRYRVWILRAETLQIGYVSFTSKNGGQATQIPAIVLGPANAFDEDQDGLPNICEFVVGTGNTTPDSDSDGIPDGAEVQNGTDPLDGLIVQTGLVASTDTPGVATDLTALNDVVIVADGQSGITVLNVFNGMDPQVVARVDTPGRAERIATSANWVVVTDSSDGVAIVDITDPPAAAITHQVGPLLLGGFPQAVVAADRVAYTGLSTGQVVSVDLASGDILERVQVGIDVKDLVIGRDTIYVLTTDSVVSLPLLDRGGLEVGGSTPSPGSSQQRLVAAGDLLYVVRSGRGLNTFDLSADPLVPALISSVTSVQNQWRHYVVNGSGTGVAAVRPNSQGGANSVSLFDSSDANNPTQFITTIATPGDAQAVSIYNGIAYVADGNAGVQVINYLAFDALGNAPSVSLETNFGTVQSEEGKLVRVSALVNDDVQVRNVEWYLDGQKFETDGNFPFALRFTTPALADQPIFTVRARASDTGGNFTWSQELRITITPDSTAPRVRRTVPRNSALRSDIGAVAAFFDEPLDPATVDATTFAVVEAGPDTVFGTGDDVPVSADLLELRTELQAVFFEVTGGLAPGRYQATINGVADVGGNALATPEVWEFAVYGGLTTDT